MLRPVKIMPLFLFCSTCYYRFLLLLLVLACGANAAGTSAGSKVGRICFSGLPGRSQSYIGGTLYIGCTEKAFDTQITLESHLGEFMGLEVTQARRDTSANTRGTLSSDGGSVRLLGARHIWARGCLAMVCFDPLSAAFLWASPSTRSSQANQSGRGGFRMAACMFQGVVVQ